MSKSNKSGASTGKRMMTLLVVLPLLIVILVQVYFLLMVCWYSTFNPRQTNMMSDQLDALQAKNPRAVLKYEWVPYDRISIHLKRAVIAAEDANFADHDGVDWEALQKAYEKNNRRHKVVGGGSTITQQLAKNLFLSGSRSYLRKGQELVIAYMLETVLTKGRILELYLNVVEYGRGIFGAEAAARHYYRTNAASLGPAQAARLAVMLPNPRYYDRHRDTRYLNRRTNLILNQMGASDVP